VQVFLFFITGQASWVNQHLNQGLPHVDVVFSLKQVIFLKGVVEVYLVAFDAVTNNVITSARQSSG